MELVVSYLFYVLGLVGVVFIFSWFHYKLEIIRFKHRVLKDLVDKGYETKNIDLNKYIK